MITSEVTSLAQQLWNYHQMNHKLAKSDCILALGSHDLRVAQPSWVFPLLHKPDF
jgi:hypothetical protein